MVKVLDMTKRSLEFEQRREILKDKVFFSWSNGSFRVNSGVNVFKSALDKSM